MLAIELATVKRDQAVAQSQAMLRAQVFAQDQMKQLQQYAQETDQRWVQAAQRSTNTELLHHQYQFMGRLNQAIALQDGALASAARRVEDARQHQVQADLRLASLKLVLSQRQATQAKVLQRRDQKEMDEFASQQTQRQLRLQVENG